MASCVRELCPHMNAITLAAKHEVIGDRYRHLMKLHGVAHAPPVVWSSGFGHQRTFALILWDDEPEEVAHCGDLAAAVAERVVARVSSGN